MIDPPPDESGRGRTVLELDFLKRSEVTCNVVDVLLFNVAGDSFQDLENVGAVVTLAQKGKSQFAGHNSKKGLQFGGVFLGRCLSHKFSSDAYPRRRESCRTEKSGRTTESSFGRYFRRQLREREE